MTHYHSPRVALLIGVSLASLHLTGCKTAEQLSRVGEQPVITHVQDPTKAPDYQPVTMPMPAPQVTPTRVNSLWQTGAKGFFKDQRACRVGDILTVIVNMDDKADISNTTTRSRKTTENMNAGHIFGLEAGLTSAGIADPSKLVGLSNNPTHSGTGTVSRSEKITMKVAATIIQSLPNGNLVIAGRQEVRVNYEVRDMIIQGVVRQEDISSANTIPYEKVAEARFSYGGRGQIDDMQQPPYGQQILNAISPF